MRKRPSRPRAVRPQPPSPPPYPAPMGSGLCLVEPTAEMVRCGEDALRKSSSGLSQLDGRKAADRIYRAMLAASPAPAVVDAGWRPIEDHPLTWDGIMSEPPRVLVWGPKCGVQMGVVHVYHDHRSARAEGFRGDWQITHWQPLPSAPSQDAPPPRSLSNKD